MLLLHLGQLGDLSCLITGQPHVTHLSNKQTPEKETEESTVFYWNTCTSCTFMTCTLRGKKFSHTNNSSWGDQLTCERIRGAHMAHLDGDIVEERLEGLLTMVEDFHEKVNFLQALMDRFYKTASATETGTLYQLRNVINRRNVVKNVSADYHADGSFIDLVTTAHVIVAALKAFGMANIEDPRPKSLCSQTC